MHRVRLITMEPDDGLLLTDMARLSVIREPIEEVDLDFPEYDYYCSDEGGLRNLITTHWGEGDWEVERVPAPGDSDLADATAERMLVEAEAHPVPGELTPADVFDLWCDWQGLVRWGPRLRAAMANLLGREGL